MTLRLLSYGLLLAIAVLSLTPVLGQEAKSELRLREVLTLTHDSEGIEHVDISPDGKRILACCSPWQHAGKPNIFLSGHAKVWDVESGKLLFTLHPSKQWVHKATFSPDGKHILAGHAEAKPGSEQTNHTVKIWDSATGKLLLTTRKLNDPVRCLAFTPDGKCFVSGSGDWQNLSSAKPGELILWETETGKEILALKGHTSRVETLAVSADGKHIVSGSGDNSAKVWDATTGKELLTFKGHDDVVRNLAISPNGNRVVSTQAMFDRRGKKQRILIWDIATGETVARINGFETPARCVAFSPDGRYVAGAIEGAQNVKGMLAIWDAATGQEVAKVELESWINSLAFHPDGKHVVGGTTRASVKVWTIER